MKETGYIFLLSLFTNYNVWMKVTYNMQVTKQTKKEKTDKKKNEKKKKKKKRVIEIQNKYLLFLISIFKDSSSFASSS